jgi:glycosyltransferase involved in cell wall biosynthesis
LKKLGLFVGENNWKFFNEMFVDLQSHFRTVVFKRRSYRSPIFQERINRWIFNWEIQSIIRKSDVCFFEWASDLLDYASHLPQKSLFITRLHSFELFDWAPRINWDAVGKIILVSEVMQKKYIDLYPKQASKTIVIYNGVDLDKFQYNRQREYHRRIGMLCNILPIKRVYEMILSFYEMTLDGFTGTLHIAGNLEEDRRYTASIKSLVEKLRLHDIVKFDGYVTDTQKWLQNIDVFVSNSYWEGQQVALLEAMASGCFCLSHNWDGVEEILPNENLYCTNDELIKKFLIFNSLSDYDKKNQYQIMREIAEEKFDIRKMISRIYSIIESASVNK